MSRTVNINTRRDQFVQRTERTWTRAFARWPQIQEVETVLDVGAHDWATLPIWSAQLPQLKKLIGVEILGRRFLRGFRRLEKVALENASSLRERGVQAAFHSLDFLELTPPAPALSRVPERLGIIFSYPFVHPATALKWGLRSTQSHPWRELLTHALSFKPEWILSIHLGEWEALLAREELESAITAGGFSIDVIETDENAGKQADDAALFFSFFGTLQQGLAKK